jgi:hypothetical protein
MLPFRDSSGPSGERAPLSRAEIETLCMLEAIPEQGCEVREMPVRLGLTSALGESVNVAFESLQAAGWIVIEAGWVKRTLRGQDWLVERSGASQSE